MTTAIKFIQDHGIDRARDIVNGAPIGKSFISGKDISADFYDIKAEKYGMADGVYKFLWDKDWCVHSYSFPEFVLNTFFISDLKRLVESVDLIKSYGGYSYVNYALQHGDLMSCSSLEQAISDYEEIYPK